jgi:nucleotide-binding universal stress UspA family protein
MTKTLVVPLDGSRYAERALPVATALATRLDATVVAMTARPHDAGEGQDLPHRYLDNLVERYGGEVRTRTVDCPVAALGIEQVVAEVEGGTVCMTTHGRGGLRWAAFGSVAEDVLRRVPPPVLLVGRHASPPATGANELLVCWDGAPESYALLAVACTWARALDLTVNVAYVAHPLDFHAEATGTDVFDDAVGKVQAEGLRAVRTLLTAAYIPGALADLAAQRPTALLAVATHARTGLARVGAGSVAMGVVSSAPLPVLVARAAV